MTTDGHVSTEVASPRRLFAVIPAAGHSRRMGRPKLLLPVQGSTVIARLLAAIDHPAIVARMVVIRQDDVALRDEVARCGAWPVSPEMDPPDMRTSIEYGLTILEDRFHPHAGDGWLMLPGDHPELDHQTVAALVAAWFERSPRILIPTFNGERGHPLIATWATVPQVRALPREMGLNHLLKNLRSEISLIPVGESGVVRDLDFPSDYERLLQNP